MACTLIAPAVEFPADRILEQGQHSGKQIPSDRTDRRMKTRTEITIEKHRILRVRGRSGSVPRWCNSCGPDALMVSPVEAAVLAGVSVRTINRCVEAETVHFVESIDGRLYVCVRSIPRLRLRLK